MHQRIRAGGGKGGRVMCAPGDSAGLDARSASCLDVGGGIADVNGAGGGAIKPGEGAGDTVGMRFVVGDVVRADEDVNLRADAERIAVGAENGAFFAAADAGLPLLRPERGEQSGDAGIQADVRVGGGSVVLAKVASKVAKVASSSAVAPSVRKQRSIGIPICCTMAVSGGTGS